MFAQHNINKMADIYFEMLDEFFKKNPKNSQDITEARDVLKQLQTLNNTENNKLKKSERQNKLDEYNNLYEKLKKELLLDLKNVKSPTLFNQDEKKEPAIEVLVQSKKTLLETEEVAKSTLENLKLQQKS